MMDEGPIARIARHRAEGGRAIDFRPLEQGFCGYSAKRGGKAYPNIFGPLASLLPARVPRLRCLEPHEAVAVGGLHLTGLLTS